MDNFFTQQEFDSVKKQRLSAIIMIVLVLTVYFALFITTIISYLRLPYQDAKGNLYKAMLYVVTVVVIVYLYIFIGIRYKRVNKYYKMLLRTLRTKAGEENLYDFTQSYITY